MSDVIPLRDGLLGIQGVWIEDQDDEEHSGFVIPIYKPAGALPTIKKIRYPYAIPKEWCVTIDVNKNPKFKGQYKQVRSIIPNNPSIINVRLENCIYSFEHTSLAADVAKLKAENEKLKNDYFILKKKSQEKEEEEKKKKEKRFGEIECTQCGNINTSLELRENFGRCKSCGLMLKPEFFK